MTATGIKMRSTRISESDLNTFGIKILTKIRVSVDIANLAVRSMLDASLMGIDSHGIEALPMYVTHIQEGGLKANAELIQVEGRGGVELWDMQYGFGLASARKIMMHAIEQARSLGVYLATCRNANHIGACGVYGKIAADKGFIGIVSQQTNAALSPWGGREPRIGASPFAFIAPVENSFPFYFDASMAAITRAQVKSHMRQNQPLPEGAAQDVDGNPTVDPEKAWLGQLLPIGKHKGVGLAMVFEILSCVLSGNRFSNNIPSIVDNPRQSAGSSLFVMVINPEAIMPSKEFAQTMKRYIDYIESSPARDPDNPPRYPGRREGENWNDRIKNGILVSTEFLDSFDAVAQ